MAAEVVEAPLEQRVEEAMQLVGNCNGGEEGGLWGFEPALDPRAALSALVEAQRALLSSMQAAK
jgi:hypothetical protein